MTGQVTELLRGGVYEGGYGGGDGGSDGKVMGVTDEVTGEVMGKVRVEPETPRNFTTRLKLASHKNTNHSFSCCRICKIFDSVELKSPFYKFCIGNFLRY